MNATKALDLLNDDQFYEEHYRSIRSMMSDFIVVQKDCPSDSIDTQEFRAIVDVACRILAVAFEVCGLRPPSTTKSISAYARQCLVLSQEFERCQHPHLVACATDLQKRASFFLKDQSPDGPHRFRAAIELLRNASIILGRDVFNHFAWRRTDPRTATTFYSADASQLTMSDASRNILDQAIGQLEGWCSPQKSALLFQMVREKKPRLIVEIGIYGGRSIIPMALASRENGMGEVFGIETWSPFAATRYRTNISNDFWWLNIDFATIKKSFLRFIVEHDLHDVVKIIEASSDRAHVLFDQIDMLHIDGGHSVFGAAQDTINFVSKLRPGGIVVYDDIDWATTGPGLEIVMDTCQLLHVVEGANNPGVPGCAVFIKT